MSPIIARVAARTATRTAGQRQFSIMSSMRKLARGFEPHPFGRPSASPTPQAADWGKHVKRVGSQAIVYFPAFAVILGWPYGAQMALDGHV